MTSRSFTTLVKCFLLLAFAAAFGHPAEGAIKVAVIDVDKTEASGKLNEAISTGLARSTTVLDADLAAAAMRSSMPAFPLNMTTAEARQLGSVIGCEFIAEVHSVTQRRNATGRGVYWEAYAATYLISSRTGQLVDWQLHRSEGAQQLDAEKELLDSAVSIGESLGRKAATIMKVELARVPYAEMEEPPDPGSPLSKNFKAPVPFRRIKPEYTSLAAFYEVAATVEIMVDLDADGRITRTEIVRWAGFGLDESVEAAVRQMNWRPAERVGKFIPMRFLLRYNFKKIDKDQN